MRVILFYSAADATYVYILGCHTTNLVCLKSVVNGKVMSENDYLPILIGESNHPFVIFNSGDEE